MIAPTLDQLAAESAGRYTIAKLNVDENPRTAAEYRIEGIPTLLLFKNGKLVDRIVGLAPKPTIAQKLAALT
jgi:thioredoxin-like negative regulator of GroEL